MLMQVTDTDVNSEFQRIDALCRFSGISYAFLGGLPISYRFQTSIIDGLHGS